jgi:predicted SAM-dependent methyltransferase
MKLINIGCGNHYHKEWINLDLYNSKHIKKHNIKNKLPFGDNSVDVIYHSHVLEHLDKQEGAKFITDCHRVLKNGGVMRLCIPDLEQICIEYLNNLNIGYEKQDVNAIKRYRWNKLEMYDQVIRKKSGGNMINFIKEGLVDKDYVVKRSGDEMQFLFDNKTQESFFKKILRKFYNIIKNSEQKGEIHKWMYDKLDLKILLSEAGFKNFEIMKFNTSKIKEWNRYELDKSKNGDFARKPDSLFVEVTK